MTEGHGNFWESLAPEENQVAETPTRRARVPTQSEAWRESIFQSEERLSAARSTTRFPVDIRWSKKRTKASGRHEQTACLLVDHLWAVGLVSRWKLQPLCLSELGGPIAIPDILVELRPPPKPLHLIQIKAARFVTKVVEEEFQRQRCFAENKGFGFHVWTNDDVLGGQTPHTLNCLDRGRRNQPSRETVAQIRKAAGDCKTLGELLPQFGWDDVEAAAAGLAFFFDVTKRMDEKTPISSSQPSDFYEYLFAGSSTAVSFWDSLPEVWATSG